MLEMYGASGDWEGGESRTNKTLTSIIQLIIYITFDLISCIRNLKHKSIHNTLTHIFGDLETFLVESKIGVGMIPTSFSIAI